MAAFDRQERLRGRWHTSAGGTHMGPAANLVVGEAAHKRTYRTRFSGTRWCAPVPAVPRIRRAPGRARRDTRSPRRCAGRSCRSRIGARYAWPASTQVERGGAVRFGPGEVEDCRRSHGPCRGSRARARRRTPSPCGRRGWSLGYSGPRLRPARRGVREGGARSPAGRIASRVAMRPAVSRLAASALGLVAPCADPDLPEHPAGPVPDRRDPHSPSLPGPLRGAAQIPAVHGGGSAPACRAVHCPMVSSGVSGGRTRHRLLRRAQLGERGNVAGAGEPGRDGDRRHGP